MRSNRKLFVELGDSQQERAPEAGTAFGLAGPGGARCAAFYIIKPAASVASVASVASIGREIAAISRPIGR